MHTPKKTHDFFLNKQREFEFVPRIINPIKMQKAIILSAEQEVRTAGAALKENMPWIDVDILSDPISAADFKHNGACVFLFDDTALLLTDTEKIKRQNRQAMIVLLSLNELIHCSPPSVAEENYPMTSKADLIFAINKSDLAPEKIIPSSVRASEDLLNIRKKTKLKRFIFLIVDDEPRWFSQFLPVLYRIIGQRAVVKITRTYEETIEFLFAVNHESQIDKENYSNKGFGDDVVCLITDISFPKGKTISSEAGKSLISLTHTYYPRIPIIIASKTKEAEKMRHFSFVLPKGDPGSLDTLRKYIHDFTGIGDFLVCTKSYKELYRIKNIGDMYDLMAKAEKDTEEAQKLRVLLEDYGRKDMFSTWLYMHSYRELGDKLRPIKIGGRRMITVLKRHLKREILRTKFTPLTIGDRKIFDLRQLWSLLKKVDPEEIQKSADNDVFSSWLDRKGYSELAEMIRPIHGSGKKLTKTLAANLEKWLEVNPLERTP